MTYVVLGYTACRSWRSGWPRDILIAIACVRAVTALSKAYLAPENRAPAPGSAMDDAEASEAERWVALLLGLGLYGYFGLAAARRLGLPWTVHGFLATCCSSSSPSLTIRAIYRAARLSGCRDRALGRKPPGRASPATCPGGRSRPPATTSLAAWVALVYLVWAVGCPAARTC